MEKTNPYSLQLCLIRETGPFSGWGLGKGCLMALLGGKEEAFVLWLCHVEKVLGPQGKGHRPAGLISIFHLRSFSFDRSISNRSAIFASLMDFSKKITLRIGYLTPTDSSSCYFQIPTATFISPPPHSMTRGFHTSSPYFFHFLQIPSSLIHNTP